MNKKVTLVLLCHLKVSFSWLEQPQFSQRLSPLFSSTPEEAREMKEQAARLRKEIDSFQNQKKALEMEEKRKQNEERMVQRELRERYSAVVPILKPDGSTVKERCDFVPKWSDQESFITVCETDLPLGVILGESEDFAGATVVDEVAEGSNGRAAGIKEGDIVRAFTACRMEMEQPAWQLMAGGIGIPKTKRFMYSVDGRPFEEVMDAIGSNRLDPEGRPVLLVLERREDD